MNCQQVEELLPLYVGHDLEEKRAKLVTAHVQSCVECAASVDQYRQIRQLLQLFAPPPVSEAEYAGIRQRVLREIEDDSRPLTPAQLVAHFFRPRIGWAVVTALLLVVTALAFYHIATRTPNLSNAGQLADSGRKVDQTTGNNEQNAASQGPRSTVSVSTSPNGKGRPHVNGRKTGADTTIAGLVSPRRESGKAQRSDRKQSLAAATPDTRSTTAEASPQGNNVAEPNSFPVHDPLTSEKTLRVEMRTKDRNIRIIWFSHQPTKQDSPRKSFKNIPEVRSHV